MQFNATLNLYRKQMLGDKSVQKFGKGLVMDVEHLLQQYFSYMASKMSASSYILEYPLD